VQVGHFRLRGEGMVYHLVDTIGIGDNRFDENLILNKLAEAVKEVKDGLNQILFVISGRFTDEEVRAFTLLRTVFFGEDIGKYTTIVRTKFPGFRDPEKRRKNKEMMMSQNEDVATILRSCRRLIHVNHLTEIEDFKQRARNDCRAYLRNYLSSNCQHICQPRNLSEMYERIRNYVIERERTRSDDQQSQINQLTRENQLLNQQIVQLQNQSRPRQFFHF
jgi:hypothetical protein